MSTCQVLNVFMHRTQAATGQCTMMLSRPVYNVRTQAQFAAGVVPDDFAASASYT